MSRGRLLKFPRLTPGRLLRRYKRFLGDVELGDGSVVTVHVPNSGSMTSCSEPGSEVLLSHHSDPKRKLPWTLELVRVSPGQSGWAGVNTALPNRLVAAAVTAGRIVELDGYAELRREVKVEPGSRLDMLLTGPGRADCHIEVKNVTLVEADCAFFPDTVTDRGKKHLEVLERLAARGNRAVIFFLVQRPDCSVLRPADHIDPAYGQTLRRVLDRGVEVLAYRSRLDETGAGIDGPVPFVPG